MMRSDPRRSPSPPRSPAAAAPQPRRRGRDTPPPPRQKWSFSGPFGTYDRAQLQRGFKVYREVCAVCHGLTLLSFRNLAEAGGLGYSEAQVKQLAAEYKVQDGPNDQGEMFERAGRPADRFPPPLPNENAARVRYNARAAGHVGDRQGAHLRARLPLVRVRYVHPVPGAGRRLHRGAAAGLRGQAAGRRHAAAGAVLQQVFPRPRHRDAEADGGWPGHL